MTTHRRSEAKPPGWAGSAQAPMAPAAPRRRWVIAAGVFALVAIGGVLVLMGAPRPDPAPPAQVTPTAQPAEPAAPTPAEKAAALKEQELRLAEQLLKEFPDSEEPLVLLGDVHRRRGNIDQSALLWEQALQRNPRRTDVYDRLARLALDTDNYTKAIEWSRRALEVDPKLTGAHVNIAKALMALGQYEESIPESQEEAKLALDVPLPHFLLGQAYQQSQEYEKARDSYEKVVALQPDHGNAHYGLYNVYTRLKQSDEAQHHLAEFKRCKEREARELRRRDQLQTDSDLFAKGLAKVCVGAHELYRKAGDGAKMEAMLQQAVELDPNNISSVEKLVAVYRATNRIPEALALCRRIEQIDPNYAPCQLNIGRLAALLHRFDDAEKAIQKVIALLPDHYAGYQELARLYLMSNTNLPRARELAQKAVELEPRADNYFVLGWACDINGDPARAMAAIENAMALAPENPQYKQVYQQIRKKTASRLTPPDK